MVDPDEHGLDEGELSRFERLVEATAPPPEDVAVCRCLRCVDAHRREPRTA